jgi:methylase of polypeptide subunit release factors
MADRGEVRLEDLTSVLDPGRVLADHEACGALAELVDRLRSIGYDGSDHEVVERDAVHALGPDAINALMRSGALACCDGDLELTARLFPMRSVYTFLPRHEVGLDTVYFGPDSLVLFEIIWAARGHGDRAVDLASGNGFIAAAMATRYDHVVAADLSGRCVSTAALVPVVNPHLRGRFSAVQTDVAQGLRAGSFDLVTANTPWVPETVGPDGGPPRRFAAGGPTGFELPRRFIDAAADLVAPGGRAFIACLDIAFDDGRRPLTEHLDLVRRDDLQSTIVETRRNEHVDYTEWARRKVCGATFARHVVVELRRSVAARPYE